MGSANLAIERELEILRDLAGIGDEEFERHRRAHRSRVETVFVPLYRLLGFIGVSIMVGLHNRFIEQAFDWHLYGTYLLVVGSYTLISWLALQVLYPKFDLTSLPIIILVADVFFWLFAIYYSGGEKSLLFLILLVRCCDQVIFGVKRVLFFTHFIVFAYLGFIAYLSFIELREINPLTEATKAAILYITGLYIVGIAITVNNMKDRTVASMVLARDLISELTNQKRELDDALQSAKEAVTLRSRFLSTMSHEIRSPMHVIINMAELLKREAVDDKRIRYANAIRSLGNKVVLFIEDVLNMSRLEAGKVTVENINYSLANLVTESREMLTFGAEEKGIPLNWHVADDLPDALSGDPMRLQQVLLNLVGNAIKFTSKGSVDVTIWRKLTANKDALFFEVSDTGIGIDNENIGNIFNAFTQSESSTPREYGGSGLGLAISKDLVGLMGGEIEVESELGSGSTFRFFIPITLPVTAPEILESPPALKPD